MQGETMEFGEGTLGLLETVLAGRSGHAVALMRHSAREFVPGRHDLENPLTPAGRELAVRLGQRLPKDATVRAYASPPARCMETAELILSGHREHGGAATRHRPLESLGVFYALDQMQMWKRMQASGGLVPFVQSWIRGGVPGDAMMPAELAARLLLRVLAARLAAPVASAQLDLCVSHDMTLYFMRELLLAEPADGPEVRFLDALVLFAEDGQLWLTSHHGTPRRVTDWL